MINEVTQLAHTGAWEPSTRGDVEAVNQSSGELVTDDRLRQLVAAWLLGFKSQHTVRS